MSTVQDYALEQLHWIMRRDPWIREIMRAGGGQLDPLAEQIVAMWHQDDFSALDPEQCTYYERLLGLIAGAAQTIADRRSAIEAAWKSATPPTMAQIQEVADSWRAGEVTVDYDYETMTVTLSFSSVIGIPHDIGNMKAAIERFVPAHLTVYWDFRYLTIAECEAKTLAEIEALEINNFGGGG